MGACASKFKEFDSTADEVPPMEAKEEAAEATQREVMLLDDPVSKDDVKPPAEAAMGGEAKPQSLGRLLEEEVKQEAPTKDYKNVETGGLKTDGKNTRASTPASESVENEAPVLEGEGKLTEHTKIAASEEVETTKTTNANENKAGGGESSSAKKLGTLEADNKTEEPVSASEEQDREIEDKPTPTTKTQELKPASDEEKKVEEKQTKTAKIDDQKPTFDEEKNKVDEKLVGTTFSEEYKPSSEEEKTVTEVKCVEVVIQKSDSGVDEEEKLADDAKNEKLVYEIPDKRTADPLKAESDVGIEPDEKYVCNEK